MVINGVCSLCSIFSSLDSSFLVIIVSCLFVLALTNRSSGRLVMELPFQRAKCRLVKLKQMQTAEKVGKGRTHLGGCCWSKYVTQGGLQVTSLSGMGSYRPTIAHSRSSRGYHVTLKLMSQSQAPAFGGGGGNSSATAA